MIGLLSLYLQIEGIEFIEKKNFASRFLGLRPVCFPSERRRDASIRGWESGIVQHKPHRSGKCHDGAIRSHFPQLGHFV